jgi:hypothetical protein
MRRLRAVTPRSIANVFNQRHVESIDASLALGVAMAVVPMMKNQEMPVLYLPCLDQFRPGNSFFAWTRQTAKSKVGDALIEALRR